METGRYSANYLAFRDANGTYVVLDGEHGSVTITYPDETNIWVSRITRRFSGLSVTGWWTGADQSGYGLHRHGPGRTSCRCGRAVRARGDGDEAATITSLGRRKKITYDYAGAYAPPLVRAGHHGRIRRHPGVTLSWTAAGGWRAALHLCGLRLRPGWGNTWRKPRGLTATVTDLMPGTPYTYQVLTTDSAGRMIKSAPVTVLCIRSGLGHRVPRMIRSTAP